MWHWNSVKVKRVQTIENSPGTSKCSRFYSHFLQNCTRPIKSKTNTPFQNVTLKLFQRWTGANQRKLNYSKAKQTNSNDNSTARGRASGGKSAGYIHQKLAMSGGKSAEYIHQKIAMSGGKSAGYIHQMLNNCNSIKHHQKLLYKPYLARCNIEWWQWRQLWYWWRRVFVGGSGYRRWMTSLLWRQTENSLCRRRPIVAIVVFDVIGDVNVSSLSTFALTQPIR